MRCRSEPEQRAMVEPVLGWLDLRRNSPNLAKNSKNDNNNLNSNVESLLQQRRSDHISHFLLRLAFCRSADLRDWFCTLETALFKMRYQLDVNAQDAYIASARLDLTSAGLDDLVAAHAPRLATSAQRATETARLISMIRATYQVLSLTHHSLLTSDFMIF